MPQKTFIEDIFKKFAVSVFNEDIDVSSAEYNAVQSFYQVISVDEPFTIRQSKYVLAILSKYSGKSKSLGFDYADDLVSPLWKKEFRVLDTTKSVWIEEIEDEKWICLKIPFLIKEELEKFIKSSSSHGVSIWDHENKIRKLRFYDFNLIQLNEFFEFHNFQRQSSFLEAVSEVESIWDQQDQIIPRSIVVDDSVNLLNVSKEVESWFDERKQNDVNKDLMLARSMGIFYNSEKNPKTMIEKICSSTSTNFWIKDLKDFFSLYKRLECTVAIITDKDEASQTWIKQFVEISRNFNIPTDDIKVCFRLPKDENSNFNTWIKEAGVGGAVDNGKIFIFHNKPAKWLFSSEIDVKIIATNSLYPVPNAVTQSWMNSHNCVCFIGELRASQIKDKNIVSL